MLRSCWILSVRAHAQGHNRNQSQMPHNYLKSQTPTPTNLFLQRFPPRPLSLKRIHPTNHLFSRSIWTNLSCGT